MKKLKKLYWLLLKKKKDIVLSLFGDRNYKKFVIISRSRTGSTLLMALLNKHKNIICEGELFKVLHGKSCRDIWDELYGKKPKRIKFIGFKLFYYHPFDDDKEVWDFIENDKDIAIIHLTRKHYLEAYLSQKIGEKTKQWSESKFRPHDITLQDKVVRLDSKECKETFQKINTYEKETMERFKDHEVIEVDYKDLNEDKEGIVSSIFTAFQLPMEKVQVVNKKQNSESMSELIENYQELKDEFANTEWSYLFE